MVIQEMTRDDCLNALARARLGRLACTHENQPYVVPIYFVYEEPYLYGFTTPGLKVEWMRSNPLVCVELDAVEDPEAREELFEEMVERMYTHGKALNTASHFEIDDVIDPADTRRWILAILESAPAPIPREGKKRPNIDTW